MQAAQHFFPDRKVFRPVNECLTQNVSCYGISAQLDFLAVYAGATAADADAVLRRARENPR